MKLPIPSVFKSANKTQYFLSLLLRDEKATAVIIEESLGSVKILSKHEEYFATPIEDASEEEWLDIIDKTISRAEEILPPNIETQKTVFGVKDSWVEEKRIKKDYLLKLKKVCEALSLTPIGFLVISEAIIHLMQEEEGAPVSAVLTEIGKRSLMISLIRGGKIVETRSVPRTEEVALGVDAALKTFQSDVLPSRVVIFDGLETEKLSQLFISHQWSKSLPFLHMPQISILPPGFDAKAVVFGAAVQMGFTIVGDIVDKTGHEIKTLGHTGPLPKKEHATVEDEPTPTKSLEPETEHEEVERIVEAKETTQTTDGAEAFGFLTDVDVATVKTPPPVVEEPIPHTTKHEEKSHDVAPVSDSLHMEGAKTFEEVTKEEKQTFAIHHHEESQPSHQEHTHPRGSGKIASLLAGISLPKIALPRGNGVFIIPVLLVLLIGIGLAYVFLVRAAITLTIRPEVVDQTETIVFSTKSDTDTENHTVGAKKITVTLDGTSSTEATGKKDTGNKAKGTVTLYNSAETKKQLSVGATITSSNGLDFIVDKDVVVASSSGDIFSGIKSGTAQVAVTAKTIGSEYNLPSNTKFTVSGISSLAAKNDAAFSGGSKKQVTVVAKGDIDKLTADLPKSLEGKAKQEIAKKIGSDETVLPLFLNITLAKKSFNKDVGEETKTVTLKTQVTFDGIAYKNENLNAIAKSIISDKSSENQAVSEKGVKNTLRSIKEKNEDEVSASLVVNAGLLPKIDTTKVLQDVKGKSFSDAEELLSQMAQIDGVDIVLIPNIPFLPKLLPRLEKNIKVTVQTNE